MCVYVSVCTWLYVSVCLFVCFLFDYLVLEQRYYCLLFIHIIGQLTMYVSLTYRLEKKEEGQAMI